MELETYLISIGCVTSPVFELVPAFEITTIFGFKGYNHCSTINFQFTGFLNKCFALLLRSMGCAKDSLASSALTQNRFDYSFLNCLTKPAFKVAHFKF